MAHLLLAILGVSLIVIVHETGHYLVARAFGMRVTTFSIGIGPALVKYRPRGGATTFQICLVPLLAYVRIASAATDEDVDPKDPSLYENKGPLPRALMVLGGPVANYLFASVLVFALATTGWREQVQPDPTVASAEPGSRAAETRVVRLSVGDAASLAVRLPFEMTVQNLEAIADLARRRTSEGLTGPVGMVKHVASSADQGVHAFVSVLVAISVALGYFNLLPFPFLDGGRLLFLLFEAVARRRADPRVEALVHAVGLLLLLGMTAAVTWRDVLG